MKVSTGAKEPLIRLKARTGIAHRNVLCRWAFGLSLRQPAPPAAIDVAADSHLEMTWPVFGGEAHELYLALPKQRCARDGLGTSEDVLARQFRLHLRRGIASLAAPQALRSIAQLVQLALGEEAHKG
ncbi:MAG TPA: DNA sulfur modification protein DndE [Isosphaeraceae bacterium]|nr:DNA sulfur modification protein DndE [Isosphaeraceae bacterium]